tara:strand:- start:861 stop:2141 length:1281 start_codon:yes stop_codon:yes gene_type:complete
MTTLAGHYGSDNQKNRFPVPSLKGTKSNNEKYFVLVDKKTGEKKIYNENFGSDTLVGSVGADGKFKGASGAKAEEIKAFSNNEGLKLINDQATKTVLKEKLNTENPESPETAITETNDLVKKNNAKTAEKNLTNSKAALTSASVAEKGTRNSFPNLVYPKSLRKDLQDVIKFTMMKYEPKDVATGDAGITFTDRNIDRRSIGSVLLPIPGGISDGNSVSWNNEDMDPIALAKGKIALKTIMEGGEGLTDSAGDIANTLKNNAGVKEGVANLLAGAASGTGGQFLKRTTGQILNPNMELLFQGPSLRDFTFQFKLAPRSEEEGKEVIKIIRFFKQGMAAIRSKSRLFLKSPHTFKLQYLQGEATEHKYLNKFKECALQSCGVTYGEAQYSTYEDGIMSSYNIQLGFKELEPIFNDEYPQDNDASIGF